VLLWHQRKRPVVKLARVAPEVASADFVRIGGTTGQRLGRPTRCTSTAAQAGLRMQIDAKFDHWPNSTDAVARIHYSLRSLTQLLLQYSVLLSSACHPIPRVPLTSTSTSSRRSKRARPGQDRRPIPSSQRWSSSLHCFQCRFRPSRSFPLHSSPFRPHSYRSRQTVLTR